MVGDFRLIRTFRLGKDGRLFPVNTAAAWTAGWNVASCGRGRSHTPPADGCRCGFYLYADPAYALDQPPARQVLAVCSARGLLAGSRGARAHEARIDAVWLGPRVCDRLALAAADQYPSVGIYRDLEEMLTAHPLSRREGFRSPRLGMVARRRLQMALLAFLAGVAVGGSLPATASPHLLLTAVCLTLLIAAAALSLRLRK